MKQTVTIQDEGPCRKLVKVEVDITEVDQRMKTVADEFQKMARLPGFRPGHAPREMIEKRYAKEIQQEVLRTTIPESYQSAIADNHLHAVMMPQIDKVEYAKGQPLRYEAKIEVAPEFSLPQYKGVAVKKQSSVVSEEDVDKTLETLQQQRAEFIDATGRTLAMDDFAVIRYSAVCEGKPIQEVAPQAGLPKPDQDFWLMMATEAMAPGFCEQLVGAGIGDRKQVLVDYPENFVARELAGKKATFFVEIKGIKEKKLPPLDDAFAASFKEKDLATLKEKIREDVAKEKQASVAADVRRQIMDYLLRSTQFQLPPQMVAEETRGVLYDFVKENMRRGVTKETIDAKKDEIFGFASKSAEERVRASFILARIAEEEKITVEKKETEARLEEMVTRYQIAIPKLRKQLEERGGILEIQEQILRSKTLDFLEANAKLEPA
jgi:trigger factor